MKTYRCIKPFTISDAAGLREYTPGPREITESELGPYVSDLLNGRFIEPAAAPKPPKSAPAVEPKETA